MRPSPFLIDAAPPLILPILQTQPQPEQLSPIPQRIVRVLMWIGAVILVAGIGLSRIYLGVHYPTDVIAGYIAGSVWVSILLFMDRVCFPRAPGH